MKQKGPPHPRGDDPMDIGALGKGKGKQSKGMHGKGKAKGKKRTARIAKTGQEQGFDGMLELWKAWTSLERLLEQERQHR